MHVARPSLGHSTNYMNEAWGKFLPLLLIIIIIIVRYFPGGKSRISFFPSFFRSLFSPQTPFLPSFFARKVVTLSSFVQHGEKRALSSSFCRESTDFSSVGGQL